MSRESSQPDPHRPLEYRSSSGAEAEPMWPTQRRVFFWLALPLLLVPFVKLRQGGEALMPYLIRHFWEFQGMMRRGELPIMIAVLMLFSVLVTAYRVGRASPIRNWERMLAWIVAGLMFLFSLQAMLGLASSSSDHRAIAIGTASFVTLLTGMACVVAFKIIPSSYVRARMLAVVQAGALSVSSTLVVVFVGIRVTERNIDSFALGLWILCFEVLVIVADLIITVIRTVNDKALR